MIIFIFDKCIIGNKRIRPTPPNFKRILAKITEPNVGASTCAIGSQ